MSTTLQSTIPNYEPVSLDAVRAARDRIAGVALRTPLVRLDADDVVPAGTELYLKLECLQPIRSFKIRGAYNAMAKLGREALAEGVWTTSAGNMAQGAAWAARVLGIPCRVVVPETAPETKIAAVRRYGGEVVRVPVNEWFATFRTRRREGMTGVFVHPFSDPAIMAGTGTIGLEIAEDLPDVDAVVVPWGGGGLCCGIASALAALKPGCPVYASEVETGAPLAPSLAAGHPVDVSFTPNFVDGIGAPFVNPEMFALAQRLVAGALVVSPAAAAEAMRLIIERNRVVPEGAGAVATTAALAGMAGKGKIVCIVSGGNVDFGRLVTVLQGGVP